MKNFIKRLDWKKFVRYEIYCFLIVGLLYANSVWNGLNVFPENTYVIPVTVIGFAVLMLLKSHIVYYEKKYLKKR